MSQVEYFKTIAHFPHLSNCNITYEPNKFEQRIYNFNVQMNIKLSDKDKKYRFFVK